MSNIIRADFYRIIHSKMFYMTQVALFITLLGSILSHTTLQAGMPSEEFMSLIQTIEKDNWNGSEALLASSLMAGLLTYFYIPLFNLSVGFELTRGTIKNMITIGVSRWQFFISKYVVFVLISAFEYILYYVFSFAIASLHSGIGTFDNSFFSKFIQSVGIQFISLQAIFIITLLVLYTFQSNILALLVTVILPTLLSTISVVLFPSSKITKYLDFQGNINSTFLTMPQYFWGKVLIADIIIIIGGGLISYAIFRKRDL